MEAMMTKLKPNWHTSKDIPYEDEDLIVVTHNNCRYACTYQGTGQYYTQDGDCITQDEIKYWAYFEVPNDEEDTDDAHSEDILLNKS
jgi:hypothetical protein